MQYAHAVGTQQPVLRHRSRDILPEDRKSKPIDPHSLDPWFPPGLAQAFIPAKNAGYSSHFTPTGEKKNQMGRKKYKNHL
ncbi:MAG: hypothetical protein C4530_17070 [Desulfobacteraceae bacterium]|nr:MAG: hypothetical protein C4530_17070 [Desulfobacteraceae bacterium]